MIYTSTEVCEPNVSEKILEQAAEQVKQEEGEVVKRDIERKLHKTLAPAVLEKAPKVTKEQALAKAKDEAAREERRLPETEMEEICKQISG